MYRAFARAVGADLSETELPLGEYASLGDFFARRLRDGVRPIDMTPGVIISPCDGVIAARGQATDGELVQVKGKTYRLDDLLVDQALAARLRGGDYVTIYLSPRDYHRVHTPVAGAVLGYDYVPGALWPVNPRVAARVDQLLAKNERVVIRLDGGKLGHIALVMVAAAGVGNMALADGAFESADLRRGGEVHRVELAARPIARGDELGAFRLGSTVVLVFEPGKAILAGDLGSAVRFGERLGSAA
jgi:phosphatidylserine decarboxylase